MISRMPQNSVKTQSSLNWKWPRRVTKKRNPVIRWEGNRNGIFRTAINGRPTTP